MANIVNYAKSNCDLTLREQSLLIEDALVLCELVYLKYDELLTSMSDRPVSIKELAASQDSEKMFADPKYGKDYKALFEAVVSSKRFCDLKLAFFINRIEGFR